MLPDAQAAGAMREVSGLGVGSGEWMRELSRLV